jgi:glycolate oxidase FAD binding subunit
VERPSDAAGVAALLRDATESGRTVQIRGGGTKTHWGGPSSTVDVILDTRRLYGVMEHEPGDLVATVRAGTPLRDLQAVLGLAGQRLALEAGSEDATVGGVLAAGEAGPLRLRYGTGRDLLIGVEFVRADGTTAHSGGRVVKNVAGYDLGRLLCGSYGTVGVMTSATFRLHPLPAASGWVVYPLSTVDNLAALVASVQEPSIAPRRLSSLTGTGDSLAVLVEGSSTGVASTDRRPEISSRFRGRGGGEAAVMVGYPFEPGEVGLKLAAPVKVTSRSRSGPAAHVSDTP